MYMNSNWPDSILTWRNQRVVVTGRAGFLGSFIVEKLHARGAAEVFVPRIEDYDLVELPAIRRMLADARPDIILHLAARVGGIGANREHPAEFFYDNLMMGVPLLHEAWRAGVSTFVALGTVCAYAEFTPVPFREEDLWNGYPAETNAPYGLAKKMLLVQSQAYRQQYGFNSIFLLPVNLYGPGDNFDPESSHVILALVRKFGEAKAKGEAEVAAWAMARARGAALSGASLLRARLSTRAPRRAASTMRSAGTPVIWAPHSGVQSATAAAVSSNPTVCAAMKS